MLIRSHVLIMKTDTTSKIYVHIPMLSAKCRILFIFFDSRFGVFPSVDSLILFRRIFSSQWKYVEFFLRLFCSVIFFSSCVYATKAMHRSIENVMLIFRELSSWLTCVCVCVCLCVCGCVDVLVYYFWVISRLSDWHCPSKFRGLIFLRLTSLAKPDAFLAC